MTDEQILKMQGWTDENIERLKAVLNNPKASAYAHKTGDFNKAYEMTKPSINDWFESFLVEHKSDAETLSIALTEFAEFVRFKVENPSK